MHTHNEWWRGGVIYQVYPRSFQDTNGDGVGDLRGIAQRMGYIADLGVDAVWLSPFYTSPMKDFGYDIADYRQVDPMFGTLEDFDLVVRAAHDRGLKVIVDQVFSHTSDKHPWFLESRRDRTNPKADWYLWAEPREDGTPPNNWLSNFGGVAWEWHSARMQYYMHNFLASQPDLNFHNPEVRQALLDVLTFWLDRGVDGFRLDVVNLYYQDRELRNNPPLTGEVELTNVTRANPYAWQEHLYDKNRTENLVFLEDMRRLIDAVPGRMLLGEISAESRDAGRLLREYTEKKRLNQAYAFELMTEEFSAARIRSVAERLGREAEDGWICWSLSNHDVRRVISRWGFEEEIERAAPLLWALLLSLRGSPCVYQGEELGLTEADVPLESLQDPFVRLPEFKGRDGCRTPMPWSENAANAGFTTGTPWLPTPDSHRKRSVDVQEAEAASVLNRCRRFTAWRKQHADLVSGAIRFLDAPDNVLLFRRGDHTLAAFNLGGNEVRFPLPDGTTKEMEGHGFTGRIEGAEIVLPAFDAVFCR